jgi:hypothetical protein
MLVVRSDVGKLANLYNFRGKEAVLHYLEQNTNLIPVLNSAPEQIKNYFPEATLTLEISLDPEEPELDELVLWISSNEEVEKALDKLQELDENWWLEAVSIAPCAIRTDVEFTNEF